jgi:murein DD-endopeptidase MepM/ murein hydrolase activator NlpD
MTTPWGPGAPTSTNPSGQPTPTPQQAIQDLTGFGIDMSGTPGSTAGSTIDAGVPQAFINQVDLALRRKYGAQYQTLGQDFINQVAGVLWNQTNGVAKDYFYQSPGPTSNQTLINGWLFSPSSSLPELARQMIGMLPPNEITAADRKFLATPSASAVDVTQSVPLPFNPVFFGDVTESHAEGDPGIDYGMPVGQDITTPVAGTVHIELGQPGAGMVDANTQLWGRRVIVTTASGWQFAVGHLGPGLQVQEGEQVNPGQLLGVSGGDPNDPEGLGGYSSGPHIEVQWISPQGAFTDPGPMLGAIFGGTTYANLQSLLGVSDILGQGVVTSVAQQERMLGYDPLVDSLYGPIRSALESYLGRRPLASEIRQVAQKGLNSDQLKSYIDSLPSSIPGISHGVYGTLQSSANSEFQKLFGYQVPDSMVKELYDHGLVTPSSQALYLSQLPWGQVQDHYGVNAAYQAAQPYMNGIWNDQPHPQDLHNIYNKAVNSGYQPPDQSAGGGGGGALVAA